MVLLNPSTADEVRDDATNRRGLGYAFDWDFGSLVFCNLFAFRTPNPKEMKAATDPIGPENDAYILKEAALADMIIAGWGNHGCYMGRGDTVRNLLSDFQLYCLDVNKSGEPKHPLYCKRDLEPKDLS